MMSHCDYWEMQSAFNSCMWDLSPKVCFLIHSGIICFILLFAGFIQTNCLCLPFFSLWILCPHVGCQWAHELGKRTGLHWDVLWEIAFWITDSLRLEKTSKIMKSNCKPYSKLSQLCIFLTSPGMVGWWFYFPQQPVTMPGHPFSE